MSSSLKKIRKILYGFIYLFVSLYIAYLYEIWKSEDLSNLMIRVIIPLVPIAIIILLYFIVKMREEKQG